MATDFFMVVTDQRGVQLLGESTQVVYDPYLKKSVSSPVEVFSVANRTENTFTFDGSGPAAGKITFDPFTVTKRIDTISQTTFLAQAQGQAWKFVDILLTRSNGQDPGPSGLKPYLSYRLGTVGVSDISTSASDGDDGPVETVSFVYGSLQIGYQQLKQDGSLGPFAPVGWDRVRNIKI